MGGVGGVNSGYGYNYNVGRTVVPNLGVQAPLTTLNHVVPTVAPVVGNHGLVNQGFVGNVGNVGLSNQVNNALRRSQ